MKPSIKSKEWKFYTAPPCSVSVLPQLLKMAVGIDLHGRHGAIQACGQITHALYKVGLQTNR